MNDLKTAEMEFERVKRKREMDVSQARQNIENLSGRSRSLGREIDAAIFVNADQPFLAPEVIDRIIQRYYDTGARIVAPLYAGKRGSPVLFDHVHFAELKNLRGEEGGREVLMKYHSQIQTVEFADARLALDVDTPEEYERSVQAL